MEGDRLFRMQEMLLFVVMVAVVAVEEIPGKGAEVEGIELRREVLLFVAGVAVDEMVIPGRELRW